MTEETQQKPKRGRGRPPPHLPVKRHNIYLPDEIWEKLGAKPSQRIIDLVISHERNQPQTKPPA